MAPKKKAAEGYVADSYDVPEVPDYVVAELRPDSQIAISTTGVFAAPPGVQPQADALNAMLGDFKLTRVAPHFSLPQKTLDLHAAAPPTAALALSPEFLLGGFLQIVPESSKDAPRIAARLNKSATVAQAYVAPRPVPAGMATGTAVGSRNFEPAQGYLHSAPDGIGAMEVWSQKGGKGRGITVCDIEGNWHFTHEDLPQAIQLIGGTPIAQQSWKDHGTAVLGEIVSRPNDVGTIGIAHQATAKVHSAVINGVFNTAGAIAAATAALKAGDVILIELQATGPNGKYVAMQYWAPEFAAIQAAVAKGITVVEAAGNGDEDFNLAVFKNTGLQQDSGAIVVGAGIPPTNWFDSFGGGSAATAHTSIGVPRSRIWFSNYGKIVNVQAWGWHVATCGYGDAQGGANEDAWYTHRFSGTSSASPIVTGAVACLQAMAKAKNGAPLTPAKVRQILISTGTPQVAGPGVPLSQHIGPQPDLVKALKKV